MQLKKFYILYTIINISCRNPIFVFIIHSDILFLCDAFELSIKSTQTLILSLRCCLLLYNNILLNAAAAALNKY